MELIIFPRLNAESQVCMRRTKQKYGKPYYYEPNGKLLKRLARETGKSMTEVRNQIMKERNFLIGKQ